jgi:GNAT superfamily N-acetyltransferase
MSTPFIIYALPRSRTFWLSRYLTFGDYACAHEQSVRMRGPEDVKAWFSQDYTGTAETAAAPWWRLIQHYRPDARTLVVRRPAAEVVESLMRLDMLGVCTFDRTLLTQIMQKADRRLDQIERCVPGSLSVRYADLADETTCAQAFEHCLPYPHSHDWWAAMAPLNLQTSMPALMRYCAAHQKQLTRASAACWRRMRDLMDTQRRTHERPDGVTIQEEPFETFWRDGQSLFAEHRAAVGESGIGLNVDLAHRLDAMGAGLIITARSNGRMFGYLSTIIGPSLGDDGTTSGTQVPFFVSKDAVGMNLAARLQRACIDALRRRGVDEVIMRAGVRGSGPRLGVLYRRFGAEEFGQLYRLDLKAA